MPLRLQKSLLHKKKPTIPSVRCLYIVSNVTGVNGVSQYFQNLRSVVTGLRWNVVVLHNYKTLCQYQKKISSNDIVLLQMFFEPCDVQPSHLETFLSELPHKCCVFITIHDNYYMNGKWQLQDFLLFDPVDPTCPPRPFVYSRVNHIVCPSEYICSYFKRFFHHPSIHVVPHPDNVLLSPLSIPPIHDKLNIGIITSMQTCKGIDYFTSLFDHFTENVNYHIYHNFSSSHENIIVHGPYDGNNIYNQLIQDQIHGLIFFNQWPESYCFALSKGINSGLPIYYSPIGAVHERLSSYHDSRFHPHDMSDPLSKFPSFLHFIQQHQNTNYPPQTNANQIPLNTPEFYLNLFR